MPPTPFHAGREEKLVSQVLTPASHGGSGQALLDPQLYGARGPAGLGRWIRACVLRTQRPGPSEAGLEARRQDATAPRVEWSEAGVGDRSPFSQKSHSVAHQAGGPCGMRLQILVMGWARQTQ